MQELTLVNLVLIDTWMEISPEASLKWLCNLALWENIYIAANDISDPLRLGRLLVFIEMNN